MAFGFYFPPTAFTVAQYNEAIKRLNASGVGHPKGRRYHACFGEPDKLQIFDIWETKDGFNAFGTVLVPILQDVGVQHSEPVIMPLHNVIVPPARAARPRGKAAAKKTATTRMKTRAAKRAKRR